MYASFRRRMILSQISLLLIFTAFVRVRGQFDSDGFLSIDCGIPANTTTIDHSGTNLKLVSDEQFIDTGNSSNISSAYATIVPTEYLTLRYFPSGVRNCFTIRSLSPGFKYLVRATFFYGNYDSLNKPPVFDIYLGVNYWYTINASWIFHCETIVYAETDYLQVCLVNTGNGNPLISCIQLRQLKGIYQFVNSTQSLIMKWRGNIGATIPFVRWPYDKNDRFWRNYTANGWKKISNDSVIESDTEFATPNFVMQTAATSSSPQRPMILLFNTMTKSFLYYVVIHFSEIQSSTEVRRFDIFVDGDKLFTGISPRLLSSDWVTYWFIGDTFHNLTLVASQNSTLPPLVNAMEVYHVTSVRVPTYTEDVSAINYIKEYYKINKGWSGDPCLPSQFLWTGINCRTDSTNITRITVLNLASSFLTGALITDFGNLTSLEYLFTSFPVRNINDMDWHTTNCIDPRLNLSSNNLSGSLPTSLDRLTTLKFLDIRGNPNLLTTLPPELQIKQKNGNLYYRFGNVIPSPAPSPHKKNAIIIIAIVIVVLILIIAVAIATFLVLKRRKYKQSIALNQNASYGSSPLPNYLAKNYTNVPQAENPIEEPQLEDTKPVFPKFENRRFCYNDLKKITNDFENNIGTGGFGSVYLGHLENGFQVAVKKLSESSMQGVREFLAEAENLARVHHRYLVSLMGYCIDKDCMALVYEYMQEGNLHDKLRDSVSPLSWKQRLRIAYESALGLEYLHKACNPPLIHRDVKTSNILLNAKLEAKIADFGLSRAFDNDATTSHVSTRIVGTIGYLDPEYYMSNQLSAKSDVFSFGVVLLEIITGRPPIVRGIQEGNLIQWVHHKLSAGDIESIVDPTIQDKYDINSVWKVADLAGKCTEKTSSKRPTMSEVVIELKESWDLEMSMEDIHIERTDNSVRNISQNSTFEMAYIGGITTIGPSVR